jgi:hypothetical protein
MHEMTASATRWTFNVEVTGVARLYGVLTSISFPGEDANERLQPVSFASSRGARASLSLFGVTKDHA